MNIQAVHIQALIPPKDDLFSKIISSKLRLKNGDIVAVSSKVVSIDEGRCVVLGTAQKDALAKKESSLYLDRKHVPGRHAFHTVTRGVLIRSAGIDESNANGHYVLWPKDPMKSAQGLRRKLMKHYKVKKLGLIITDSISTPLRRGAVGFALAWAGFEPLFDYRGTKDMFGRTIVFEQANLADALAASAVLCMGEGSEQTPLAALSNLPKTVWAVRPKNKDTLIVPFAKDLFAPFFARAPWKKGGV